MSKQLAQQPSAGFPLEAVVPFDAAVCPSGWAAYAPAGQRIVVGAGSGGVDALGSPLTARTAGATGGREYTTGIPVYDGSGTLADPAPGRNLATTSVGNFLGASLSTSFVALADSNLPPFVVRLYCRNVSDDATAAPEGSTIAFASGACGSGWAEDAELNGRAVLGAGAGNLDADGQPLSPRTLGDVGGREYTTLGNVAAADTGATSVPSIARSFAPHSGGKPIYAIFPLETSFSGASADSNLPPFRIARGCRTSGASPSVDAGAIVAFANGGCPTGWSPEAEGRILLGAGSGNADAAGAPLTSRTSGATGGLEYTTGIPATTAAAMELLPDGCSGFGNVVNGYAAAPANATVFGAAADSNLPPYVVLTYCRKD